MLSGQPPVRSPARRHRLTVPAMLSILETIRSEAECDVVLAEFAAVVSAAIELLDRLRSAAHEVMMEADWDASDTATDWYLGDSSRARRLS